MKITWYGTASILLETENTSILFDPYMKALPKGQEQANVKEDRRKAFTAQKNVFITHGHFDHLSSVKELFKGKDCKVYLTSAPYRTLSRQRFSKARMQKIAPGQTVELDGVKVRVVKGKHITFIKKDLALGFIKPKRFKVFWRGLNRTIDFIRYPERKQTIMYEIELENKLVQLMGSADLVDGVDYATGADVLILPHQGRRDIDEHNEKIVKRLKPKRVFLDHYDNAFPPYSADIPVDGFCERISKTIPTQKLIEGQPLEI